MSYTVRIKDEIASINCTKSEMIAELSGFIRNNGSLSDGTIILTTENENTKERIEYFLKLQWKMLLKLMKHSQS